MKAKLLELKKTNRCLIHEHMVESYCHKRTQIQLFGQPAADAMCQKLAVQKSSEPVKHLAKALLNFQKRR